MVNQRGLAWLLLLSPFLLGLFFSWTAAIAVLFLLTLLLPYCREGKLRVSGSLLLPACTSVVIFLLLGVFRGTDRGMAPFGVLQFLPLPLFVLSLEQLAVQERLKLLAGVPHVAACMVLISVLMSLLPALSPWVMVNGRLGGFFQYPNTFAIYLLAAMVICLWISTDERVSGRNKEMETEKRSGNENSFIEVRTLELLLLTAGIILSGSRAVLCLTVAVLLLRILQNIRSARRDWILPVLILLAAVFTLVWPLARVLISSSGAADSSDAAISAGVTGWAATLLGRLLYARDAIPVILRHPLGIGYMGYASLQGSFQTGVYSVTHVHNEFLQLLLDTGWIPAVLMLAAIEQGLFPKGRQRDRTESVKGSISSSAEETGRRILVVVICLHCLFDFDTQFIAIAFLLLTALSAGEIEKQADIESRKKEKKQTGRGKNRPLHAPAIAILAGLIFGAGSLWLGTAGFLSYAGNNAAALRIYPWYTSALINRLTEAQSAGVSATESGTTSMLAGRILSLNDSIAAAHDELALNAFGRGAMETAIKEKRKAISLAKYDRVGYEEYARILTTAKQMAMSRGNREAAAEYDKELRRIPAMMQEVLDGTSRLGWMIPDQPDFPLQTD